MKLLCALLPHFPLRCEISRNPQVKRHASVVVQKSGSQKTVLDYSPELTGLRAGMELQEALSRHGEIMIIQADTPYYWSTFNSMLDDMELVSPVVEGVELGLVYLGMDGMQLIYKNDNDFVDAVRRTIPESFVIQVGIGQSKFLAYLAARQHSQDGGFRVLSGDIGTCLQDLPCDVLPISARSQKKLREFGLRTLGQIAGLPLGPVQSQFGPEGMRTWELARGHDDTPLYPRSLEKAIEEDTTLSWVTASIEAILSTLESLLVAAFAKKDLQSKGIACLTVWTRGQNARHWEKVVNFKEPAMDVKSVLPRIKYVLENYPQPGPVEQMGIKITRLSYGVGRQKSIFAEVRAKAHLLQDIKQLELRLRGPQVYEVKEIEPWSRIPERRYALAPLNR